MLLERNEVDGFRAPGFSPDPQRGPIDCVKQARIEWDAILASLFVIELRPAQVTVRQVPQHRMLERVVAVPFDNGPVELLPPRARYGEPAGAGLAHGSNRRRQQKIALQIPMRTQLL